MGDLKNPNKVSSSSSSSLPPGFRFHPSDNQLCSYYLLHKNNRNPSFSLPPPSVNPILVGVDVIQEIDLYNYDPCDLPEFSSYVYGNGGSKKHWYYFTVKGGESEGFSRRKAKGGVWKCKGRGKDVRGCGGGKEGVVVGRKRSFVFFRCNLTRLSRTNWILVEYSLVDHHVEDPFVLCRVFFKSVGVNKGVENVPPSLYAKDCIVAKQKICINVPCTQQDAPSTSGIVEVTVLEDTLADKCNDIEKSPLQLTGVPDDAIMAPVVPDNGHQSFVGVPQSGQPVNFSDWYGNGVISDDAYTLLTMDGDFLELDDLDCLLHGFDSAGAKESWQNYPRDKALFAAVDQ